MTLVIILSVLLSLSTAIFGELEIFEGKCPTEQVPYVEKLDHDAFAGEWYALYTYEKTEFMDCVNESYTWHPVERWFSIYMDRRNFSNGQYDTKLWMAKEQVENSGTGKFFEWVYTRGSERSDLAHHYIVNTDYREFAVVWTCFEKEFTNEQNLLVMTKGNLSNRALLEIFRTILKPPFNIKKLKYNEQVDVRCYRQPWRRFNFNL